jgi:NAD(P)-dependent dehydrogenase (short-subunit alcohol dehydrogenase family)
MRTLIPAMLARGHEAIAVVCSVDSLFVEDELAAYCASKGALLQVVRSAALEHARAQDQRGVPGPRSTR